MSGSELFAANVAIYAIIPLLIAFRRTNFQFLLLYTHIAAVLTVGGLLGAVYVLPLPGDVSLLAGQLSYGGFMFATLVTVIVGRDVQVVRNIVLLTASVNLLVYLVFKVAHVALTGHEVPNPLDVDPAMFDQSLDVVVLGGTLIILELLALLALLEVAKRRLSGWMAPVYVLGYVGMLALDGVLFPAVVLRPPSGLGSLIADSVPAKLVLAGAYAVPLVLFLRLYNRDVQRYEATPLRLASLVPLRRDPVLERLEAREAELEVRTAEAGRATATVSGILDAAHNTVLIAMDPEFRVSHFNVGAEQLLGYSESEVVGRTVSAYLDPAEVRRHAATLGVEPEPGLVAAAMVRAGGHHDWTLPARTGEHRVLSLSFTEIRDDGRLIGYLCAGDDVTGRMRTEVALTEALRREHESVARLEEADRVKDEVVSTISHELRTPIASIRGYVELLADRELGELTDRQADAVSRVLRNTDRLSALVGDLLDLDRAQSGSLPLSRRATDLARVTRDAWDAIEQLARGRELALSLQADDEVPVLGDPDALERVVLNLGSNAVKFTGDGGSVTVWVGRSGDRAVLRVSDSGMGISSDEQPHIRNRFFRSTEAYRHAIPGTGLGLSIVDAIVSGHDGRLEFDSSPGRGTTVTVSLPIAPGSPDGAPPV
jgi:PAS domain S-box-containing protein